jgi:hypothetical protein
LCSVFYKMTESPLPAPGELQQDSISGFGMPSPTNWRRVDVP